MHSNLPIDKENLPLGTLFVLATPIGNLEDITIRAIHVLQEVDLIAAEDTRHTRKILARYQIETPLVSFNDHNAKKQAPLLLKKLQDGKSVAIVSDAGTPSISDPGFFLVRVCVEENIPVTPIPGPCAAIAALSASGLRSDGFVFVGFLPRKTGQRRHVLEQLKPESRTLIFYESPKRLVSLVQELISVFGDRHAVLARELTKVHEEILRGGLNDIGSVLSSRSEVKGECTLLVSGCSDALEVSYDEFRSTLKRLRINGGYSATKLAKEVATMYGLSKKQVYEEILNLEKETGEE